MNLQRVFLKPIAFIAGTHAHRQARAFLAAHRRTRQVQEELLIELLSAHAETDYGRDHHFHRIRTLKEFRSAVPLNTYDTLLPYLNKVWQGQNDALLPPGQAPVMYSMTSGTTGTPKYIPVTPRFLSEMRRGWNLFGMMTLRDHPAGWLRHILQISSPACEAYSPTGVPCGAISGLLAATQKRIVRRMYAVPSQVASTHRPDERFYTTLRCSIERDVGIITTANPSSIIKMIETGQQYAERLVRDVADGTCTPPGRDRPVSVGERRFRLNRSLARRLEAAIARDGQLRPKHFWNLAFLTHWTGGTLGLYLRRLRELFDDVPIRDVGLMASEGRFTVPLQDYTPAGVAEITANVLEFIPVEEYGRDNPETLLADELDVGQEYFLVTSNWTGLWRYNMDDRVRVTDKLDDSPMLEFLSRGRHTANITGEKLTEHQVVQAMRQAGRACGTDVERFLLQGRFARTPYYELRLDDVDFSTAQRLADQMDVALAELNIEYASKRKSERLGPIRPAVLEAGTLQANEDRKISQRRGRSEQYKHTYLLTEIIDDACDNPLNAEA